MSIAKCCPYSKENENCRYEIYDSQPRFDKCSNCKVFLKQKGNYTRDTEMRSYEETLKLVKEGAIELTQQECFSTTAKPDEKYHSLHEAMNAREAADRNMNYTDVSAVMHGYIDEQETVNNETEFKDAFKAMFEFDIFDFDEAYEKSLLGVVLNSLEKAREVKAAFEYLKDKFGWKGSFSIYEYKNICGDCIAGYAVENDTTFSIPYIKKVE